MSFVSLKNVYKRYQMGEVTITASDGVSFDIEKGEFVVITGASGAGKTTVLNLMGGMDTCDEGEIIIDGKDIAKLKPRELTAYRRYDIGFVFQFYNLVQNLTAYENVELAAQTCKDKSIDAAQVLKQVGLEDRMKQPVGLLSGGQRQALTLLMATMVTPKILLLDEHTAALDPATAEKVLELTKKIIAEHRITCLMVTHNMHQALELGNRILMMDSGNIVLDLKDEEKKKMTVDSLLEQFRIQAGKRLDNDRILMSAQ